MALKVFDLACSQGHVFEGWFKSHEDYDQQLDRGLLRCPMCDSDQISKQLSAPRLNLRYGRSDNAATAATSASDAEARSSIAALQAQWVSTLRQLIKSTEDVGQNFAQEARKMHEGEVPERAIKGSATVQEYQALQEEGIDILPIPSFLDEGKLN